MKNSTVCSSKDEFLVVSFPSQGHINPSLELAKRLFRAGATVTFATAVSALNRMNSTKLPRGISYTAFSDGYDEGFTPGGDRDKFMSEMKRVGSNTLRDLIQSNENPFTHVFYSLIVPWVGDVAHSLNLPSTLLWCQPATVFDLYYYYHFGGYEDSIKSMFSTITSSDQVLQLPVTGIPPLLAGDLPPFFAPGNSHKYALPLMKWHIDTVCKYMKPYSKVLVNSFDALEEGSLKLQASIIDHNNNLELVGIGPLVPSGTLFSYDEEEEFGKDMSFGGDVYNHEKGCSDSEYIKWLDAKEEASVIFVASGSISGLSKRQKGEILRGLVESKRFYFWVITITDDEDEYECDEELGMIVKWCSQVEVLSHKSIGCFLTHCGWNSTLESLSCGVPMVGIPKWSDQFTIAKLVEDVWEVGVRANMVDGVVEADEVRRCLDLVMVDGKYRANANKWKVLAREAAKEGGSSDVNFKAFLHEITTNNSP